jgi:hypothetical protein
VSFDSNTNTITLKEDSDLFADSGSFLLKVLKDLGGASGAPEGLAADWATVAAWLGCAGRELTQVDHEKFGLAFRSYLAQGVAPSVALEKSFKKVTLMAKVEEWPIVPVPQELVPVFKRMLASDRDIQEKRANDALRFATALKSLGAPPSRRAAPVRVSEPASPVVRLNWIPLVVSIAMLLVASAAAWPYGFYQLLRLVVTVTAAYVVVRTADAGARVGIDRLQRTPNAALDRRPFLPWIMGGIAILFNPILPIYFTREEWQPINFGVAVVFLVVLIQTLRRRL